MTRSCMNTLLGIGDTSVPNPQHVTEPATQGSFSCTFIEEGKLRGRRPRSPHRTRVAGVALLTVLTPLSHTHGACPSHILPQTLISSNFPIHP